MVLSQMAIEILVAGLAVMNLSFNELLPDYLLQLNVFLFEFYYAEWWLAENGRLKRNTIIMIIRVSAFTAEWSI